MDSIDIVDSLGNRVLGIASIPDKASSVVVLSHGYSSSKGSKIYRELADEFNQASIGTLRYDYYGHGPAYGHSGPGYGASSDVTASKAVESLDAVIKYIREKGDFEIGLIGSSFGGLLSLIVASRDPDIRAVALKSPVTEPTRFWRDRINGLGADSFGKWEREGVVHYKEGLEDYDLTWEFWKDLQHYDTLVDARRISCPVLILHGDRDSYVPIDQSYELARTLGTKVSVIHGADHGYDKPEQYDDVKRLLRDFMVANLK